MQTEREVNGPYLWTVLFRASKSVERRDWESVRSLGFRCLSDFAVLEILYHKGPLPVNVIGEKVMLTSGSITTAIQRAMENGWVEKRRDSADARVTRVHLTPAGKTVIAEAFKRHAAHLDAVFSVLTKREQTTLATLLKKIGRPTVTAASGPSVRPAMKGR
jgi:MarR family 2-MHQ and catechol resistance regulon transcriptional repressor